MQTASYNWTNSSYFDVDAGLLSTAWTYNLSQMEGTHTFSGWCSVQSFGGWTHPSLANLEGQLHAQDRLKGVTITSSVSKMCKLCVIGSPASQFASERLIHPLKLCTVRQPEKVWVPSIWDKTFMAMQLKQTCINIKITALFKKKKSGVTSCVHCT